MLPFGAFSTAQISPGQVCAIENLTLIPVTMAPAGTALVVIVLLAPAGLLSGIISVSGPEGIDNVVGGAVVVIDKAWIAPLQMVAEAGLTVATSGPTVNVEVFERNNGVHGPPIATLYWRPSKLLVRSVNVKVAVEAPEYTPPFATIVQGEVAFSLSCH